MRLVELLSLSAATKVEIIVSTAEGETVERIILDYAVDSDIEFVKARSRAADYHYSKVNVIDVNRVSGSLYVNVITGR